MTKPKLSVEEKKERDRCNKIRGMLRRAWSRDPERFEVLRKSRRPYKGENARQRFEHQCNMCKKYYKQSDVQVDHVVPTGQFLYRHQLGQFAERLFYGVLQVLCSSCHKTKTKQDLLDMRAE
jgi:5-methylcytosine-specific restriction endonuclease McrA